MTEVNDNYRVYKKKVIELQRTIVRELLGVIYEQIFFIFGKISGEKISKYESDKKC